jgi:hypothetical protein
VSEAPCYFPSDLTGIFSSQHDKHARARLMFRAFLAVSGVKPPRRAPPFRLVLFQLLALSGDSWISAGFHLTAFGSKVVAAEEVERERDSLSADSLRFVELVPFPSCGVSISNPSDDISISDKGGMSR